MVSLEGGSLQMKKPVTLQAHCYGVFHDTGYRLLRWEWRGSGKIGGDRFFTIIGATDLGFSGLIICLRRSRISFRTTKPSLRAIDYANIFCFDISFVMNNILRT